MKFFTKQETGVLLIILAFIGILSFYNFSLALRRARDAQRKVDMGVLYNALNQYHADYGFYPPSSEDGKIVACAGDGFESIVEELKSDEKLNLDKYFSALRECEWGKDSFTDVLDQKRSDYISTMPQDPKAEESIKYYYIANLNNFQVYTYLEGEKDEVGFDEAIVARKIKCGNALCSFGRANGSTPLDKSLQEYENELMEKMQNEKNL